MRRCSPFLAGILILISPVAVLPADQQPNPSEPITISQPLHFDVNLVQVDAIVTDSHGQRAGGLRAEDFEVFQDGKRQQITHFLYVPAAAPVPASPSQAPRQLTRDEARRVFLIYIDDRTMSFAAFADMRRALRKFIDEEFQSGDLCAFYRASGGPGAWRAFSSDPRQARAALDHMTWLRPPPVLRDPRLLQSTIGHALSALAAMPGRKALVLVNSGITLRGGSPFNNLSLILFPMARSLADEANRASAAVYCIDARGLAVIGPERAGDDLEAPVQNVPRSGAELARQTLNHQMSYTASQNVPELLADMTGGLAFHDTNDLLGVLHAAAQDEHDYYLLGWNPGDKAFEPKGREILYHSIRIGVRRPGLKVRSRAGFFGMPEGQRTHISARSRMLYALDSPFREEGIAVDLTASLEDSAALGPHIECLLHVGPLGVDFIPQDNGCRVAHLDVAVRPQRLGEDVNFSGLQGQLATIEACGESADRVLRDGFVFTTRQSVAPGPYQMHVVVRNTAPGEGPVLGTKRLVTSSDPNATHPPVRIGSASEFVYAPDLRSSAFALSGIMLGLEGAPPQASAEKTSWHVPVPGDPAIRDFRPGDVISYSAVLMSRSDRERPEAAQLNVLFEGKPIHSETIHADGNSLRGAYHIDPSAPAGQYLLGLAIPAKGGKQKGSAAEEWINFQIVTD